MEKIFLATETGVVVYDCGYYFKFVLPKTEGFDGYRWVNRLTRQGSVVDRQAEMLLNSNKFKPTIGITQTIIILKGRIFRGDKRINSNICKMANSLKLKKPNAEIASIICENFTKEDIKKMGLLWIVAMHEPIRGFNTSLGWLLAVGCPGNKHRLSAFSGESIDVWAGVRFGFAYTLPFDMNSSELKLEDLQLFEN